MTKGKLKQLRKQLKRLRERKRLQGLDKSKKESKQLKERKSRLMLPLLNQLLKMLFRKLMTTSQVTIGLFMAITLRLASHC